MPDAYEEAERAGREDSVEDRGSGENAEVDASQSGDEQRGSDDPVDTEEFVPEPLTATPLERTRDEVDESELAVPDPVLTPEHKAAVIDSHRHDGPPNKILILGGTAEGRKLADLITEAGLDVVTSLAGRVKRPRLPQGEVRIGGFGGPQRMGRYLMESSVDLVIDATHPFAEKISASALEASTSTGTPLLRLNRPQWTPGEGDNWLSVSSAEEAARLVQERFKRPLLTIGRQQLSAFAGDARSSYLIRCVEPPEGKLPRRYLLMFDRGPFDFDSEHSLLRRHRIDVVVTKNSGGDATAAKLEAARSLHIPVIMIERPPSPPVPTVHTVAEAAQWIVEVFGSSRV
ncbi:cobalt-precorrin-6A reductase [Dietzia timorensis]|uniref:cobalt-precorrin-6A reductase n=1 Tax=Dietzia timorensis TaxID=499555 RepID=UPI001E64EF98|nr:cobalt-precorrin-6A reductase [Dietzia timorensis]